MTTENELIKKSYYQTIIDENKNEHPIKTLGDMYMEEMQKEQPDLSAIRFAQGEVYYLSNDYEAAIYKWQHPLDEQLIPWAQKNIADAHMELGLIEYAENLYKKVETDSLILRSEVLLQLFTLYKQQKQLEKSVDTIKEAIELNPDYSDVTEKARSYFEDIQDWDSAVELSVNEAIRTKSYFWFEVLEGYASHGHTSIYEPNYFYEVLVTLYYIDKYRFERLTDVLWNNYKNSDFYLQWLEEMNQLLLNQTIEQSYSWKKLPILFKEAYSYLISGRFLIHDISNLVQNHLTNWLKLSSASDRLTSSAAILAWNESFPSDLAETLISEAEHYFRNSTANQNVRQEVIELWDAIKTWAEKEGLLEGLTEYMKPMLNEYNMEKASTSKVQHSIKEALAYMFNQRIELENVILQEMNQNEEILTELHDFHEQIRDMEKEKAQLMISSFRELKSKLTENVKVKLPKVLRDCSELVREDGDFSKLHTELNEEMNKRIAQYMEKDVLPEFKNNFQEWIDTCEREFQESQIKCMELSESINQQFNEEKVVLSGDFKVLGDWQRDIERISRGLLRLEEVNILLRNNPSQLLLKGAGKLLGSLSKNKDILLNRYKDYIKNADYSEIAGETIKTFIQQLELFEESIEWDVARFFLNPQEVLRNTIEEVEAVIEKHNDSLTALREKPQIYQDLITLFELKLRQYELMNTINTIS